MKKVQLKLESPVGPIYLVASKKSLKGLHWKKQLEPLADESLTAANPIFKKTVSQLNEYFAGTRQTFDLPLDPDGTDFQKRVWEQLAAIPYGETRSYKDIAIALKNHKACRAVGTANGRNPLSIIVPCHRVISSNGTLGGFAGGLPAKEKLLRLEQQAAIQLRVR